MNKDNWKVQLSTNELKSRTNPKNKWQLIQEVQEEYKGSDSLLRTYLAKIKKEKIEEKEPKHIIERTTIISLLYKEIIK